MAPLAKMGPLLLPVYTHMMQGIRTVWGDDFFQHPSNREAVKEAVTTFEKTFAIKPSPLQLARAMNMISGTFDAKRRRSSCDSGLPGRPASITRQTELASSPPSSAQLGSLQSGVLHQITESAQASWYVVEWGEEGEACKCSGNFFSQCPGRVTTCGNPADASTAAAERQRMPVLQLCIACRCRATGCLSGARRPFRDFRHPKNFGKCRKHWIKARAASEKCAQS